MEVESRERKENERGYERERVRLKESIYIKNKKGEGGEKQGEKRRERTRQGVEGETEGKKKER